MATPDMGTSTRFREGGIVALMFTKRQLKGRGSYWILSPSGNCCTSIDFTGRLAAAGIHMSMDGRGRALDNVFIERLWRTVKYEEVYLKDYETPREAMQGLGTFFVRDNEWRQHQARGYQTPASVYFGSSV